MSKRIATKADRVRSRRLRWAVLLSVLVLSTVLGLVHQYAPSLRSASTDALCPFGGIETAWSLLSSGAMLQRVAASSLVLLAVSVLLAAALGRVFCGRFCPLGTLQEIFGALGKRVRGGRAVALPPAIDRIARYLKYAVLVVSMLTAWFAGELAIRPYDPWIAYHHLTSPELLTGFGVGLGLLVVTLVGSLFIDRFFCRYACPMGALLAIVSHFSWLKVRRAEDACTTCGACDRACPAGLQVSTCDTASPSECLACGECESACPTGALSVAPASRRSVLRSPAITAATVGTMAVVVAAATLLGGFDWAQPPLSEQVEASSAKGFDVNAIRGYMSVDEVADASGIPAADIAAAVNLPGSDSSKPMKEVTAANGFEVEDVRTFVEGRLGDAAYRGATGERGGEEH